ncbi:hypothetical protein JI735_13295 [Paenibacillus sonchi]|uniref:Uncharacterized protein n=1 Tax=Paenibacillus sonchi TaxID=373687 RepID=A0A974PH87_9BACL|nr:hypothetical protein JI735_13295 [Paenibacillus sonchi]
MVVVLATIIISVPPLPDRQQKYNTVKTINKMKRKRYAQTSIAKTSYGFSTRQLKNSSGKSKLSSYQYGFTASATFSHYSIFKEAF